MKKFNTFLILTIASFLFQSAFSQTREPVVGWNSWVNWTNQLADQGLAANTSTTVLTTMGGTGAVTFSDADGTGVRAFADGWASGANTKAWKFQFTTLKYSSLRFNCRMMGTNSPYPFYGPRDFKLQYSLDGAAWTDVSGATIAAYNGYNGQAGFTSLSNAVLPAACDNQALVYVRLLMTSNTAVNGQPVGTGQSHIDDLNVTGVSIPEPPSNIALSSNSFLITTPGASVALGSTVGSFSSTDFNLGNTFTYTLVSGTGNTDNASFSIAANTLSTAAPLPLGVYSIRIRSTDNDAQYLEKIFTVKVIQPDPITSGTRQRLSNMGTAGMTTIGPTAPSNITYNSTNNEYLTVWSSDDNTSPLVDNEVEIYGQRVNANTGQPAGSRIRISFMGPDGSTIYRGLNPSVAYNATNNEYFVVWYGDNNIGTAITGEYEIWGQRIDAATGLLLGTVLRISNMGPDGNAAYDAYNPDVSWNSTNNQYMVVWYADDNTGSLVDNENEIYGQLITGGGALSGSRIRISTMGPDGNASFNATAPAISYSVTSNKFFVIWRADDNTAPLIDNDYEIFGQALTNTGGLSGTRIRISTMGPDGDTNFGANTGSSPDITWNSITNEFFVVWSGDDNTGSLVNNENEVYGQIVTDAGALSGSRKRLSDMGPDGLTTFSALNPKVAFIVSRNEYWVVWNGDDDYTSIDNEQEIFMQRVNSLGSEVGTNDIRISFMGTMNSTLFTAAQPAIAYNATNAKAYILWQGDDNTAPLVDNEFEMFGQSLFMDAELPVTWLSFTGEMQKQAILLNWKTAAEWNTKEFVIQHSETAGNWTNIGSQLAAKNSTSVQEYNFIDPNPSIGKNYYRLQQFDQDGVYSFSKVIVIDNSGTVKLSVFPNPAAEYLTLKLPNAGVSSVSVFNNAGSLIHQEQFNDQNFVIDLKGLAPGVYHIRIIQKGVLYTRKFVKK